MVDIIAAILAPQFLVRNIGIISLVMAVMILVVLDDFLNRKLVFPVADMVKWKAHETVSRTSASRFSKYVAEYSATAIFIFYCYLGSQVLSDYLIYPILNNLRNVITIVVLVAFLMMNYILNNLQMRKRFWNS